MKHFYITLFFIVSFFTNAFSQNEFITTWQTTAANEIITIPTTGSGYNYTVDWGDGAIENGFTGNAIHTYVAAGNYTVTIIGDFPRIYFNNNGDKSKIYTIEQWGTQVWTSMQNAFFGCPNIVINATDVPDLSNVTNLNQTFLNATELVDNGNKVGDWNVSNITSMRQTFSRTKFNGNINDWDVSNVLSFVRMFQSNIEFNQPLDNWVFSNNAADRINALNMFLEARAFNQDISGWNTRQFETMTNMFFRTDNFNQNLGAWDLTNSTDIANILVESDMSQANYDATLVGWAMDTSGNISDDIDDIPSNLIFDADATYCVSEAARNTLTSTPYNWTITDGGLDCDFTNAFNTTWQTTAGNESITIPTTGNGYNYAVDWGDGSAIEIGFTGDATHSYTTAGTYTIKIIGNFPRVYFNNAGDKDKIIAITQWGNQQWTSMEAAFYGCANVIVDASDSPDLSMAVSTRAMFRGATNLIDPQGTIANWNVQTILDFGQMFMDTEKFNTPLNNWRFNVAEDLSEMFRGTKVFNQPLSLVSSTVKTLEGIFRDAIAYNQPIPWYTPSVTNLKDMFNGATSFDQNIGFFIIKDVTDMSGMFSNAGLSTENYDQTLSGWFVELNATDIRPDNIVFDGGSSQYCMAGDIIEKLENDHGWQITDSGASCDENDFFIMTWDLTTETGFRMPTSGSGYDYLLSFSNGNIYHMTSDALQVGYAENIGIFTVRIYGDFPRFDFDVNSVNKEKLVAIEQWGSLQLSEVTGAFEGCANLKLNATDTPDLSRVNSTVSMFNNCTNFEDLQDKMNDWNMGTITNISNMFEGCTTFNENIGQWDISNVFFMDSTFEGATSFNQDINAWNTSNIAFFRNTFNGATAFDQSLADWDLSGVQFFMTDMLSNSGLSQANYDATLIGWAALGTGETKIPNDVRFNTNATYCLGKDARNILTSAPNNWTITDGGFLTCDFTDAFITIWETTMDDEAITITTSTSETYNYAVDWGDGTIEGGFTGNATHTYTTAGTYTVKINGDFPRISFENKEQLLYIEQWGTQQWTSMFNAFSGCTNLKLNATDTPDLSQVTSMSSMFRDCTNLEDLKDTMNSWDMTTIERISYMFGNCTLFDENIGNWTFTNLGSSFSAFNGATAFNQDISNWNMSTVDDMESMFKNATSFNQPIGSWTLGVVDYINDFFAGATSFNQDVSNWDFSNVYEAYDMFNGASSFNQDLSAWDISNVESLGDFFTGTAMSTENYDQTLIGWATLEVGETQIPANLTLNADTTYCLSETARNTLTSVPYNWTINDGGSGCPTPVITLLGDNPQTIEQGDVYVELGAEVTYSAILTIDAAAVNTDQVGTYTVTYNATNGSGASATQLVRTIEVVDTTAPVITLNGANPQIIELGDPYIELGATTDDGSPITFDTFISVLVDSVGTYSAMYVSVDAYGNSTTIFRVVEVVDTTAPVITLIGPNPQIIELGDGYTELGATTDDGSPITLDTQVIPDEVGTYSIMYFSADVYNNSTTVFRTVEVVDTTNPTLVCQNITIQLDDTGNATMTANQIDNGTMDLSGIASLVIDVTDFDCSDVGDNMVLLTATDGNGNSESCMATVTVEDNVNPVFNPTTVPDDIEVTFDTGDMYTLADFTVGVEATDNCDTNRSTLQTTITQSPAPGTLLGVGDHVITLTITDDNSNEETATFTITVSDILSVDENTKDIFTLYPNPTKDLVWISGLNNTGRLTIYDVDGRSLKVMEVVNNQSLSTLDLPDGVYFIRIDQGNSSQTLKLIKN